MKGVALCLMERKYIEKMIKEDRSLSSIAGDMGRGRNTIIVEVNKNGGRIAYDAEIAHKSMLERRLKRSEDVSEKMKVHTRTQYCFLKQRIENMEMQLDIIIETLKELKDARR